MLSIPSGRAIIVPMKLLRRFRPILIFVAVSLLLGIGTGLAWLYLIPHNPVPANIRKSVPFKIYYPDQRHLPKGYLLDPKSFTSNGKAVVYHIYGPNKYDITISQQQRASDADIAKFYAAVMPHRTKLGTALGDAQVGTIGQMNVVSLTPTGQTWVLMSVPTDMQVSTLQDIVKTLRN
jgi:hypothetical protein